MDLIQVFNKDDFSRCQKKLNGKVSSNSSITSKSYSKKVLL